MKNKNSMVIAPKQVIYFCTDKPNGKLTTCEITCYNCSRTFRGHSLCSINDKFDKEFGEKLAYMRAMDRIVQANNKRLIKMVNNVIREKDKAINDLCYPLQKKTLCMEATNDALYEELINELNRR